MHRPAVLALAVLLSLTILGHAHAAPAVDDQARLTYEFIGFLKDGENFLVRGEDSNMGPRYEVWDTKDSSFVKVFPYTTDDEKKALYKIKREFGETQKPSDDATNPRKKDIMMLVGQKGDKLDIYMMKGDKVTKYDDIKVYKDEKSGNLAKANQKTAVWDADGKYAVIIYSQKLDEKFKSVDRDYIYSFKFKAYKVD